MQKLRLSLTSATLILGILISSVALASIIATRTLSGNITVTGTMDFQIYSDSACTTPISTLDFTIPKGTSVTKTFYLKNIGDTTLHITWNGGTTEAHTTVALKYNATNWDMGSTLTANVGIVYKIDLTITTVNFLGSYSCTYSITFNGNDS